MKLNHHCPAKINLFLEVLGKRTDGYHGVFTLYQSLECGDDLEVSPSPEISLIGAENLTQNPEDNLIIKAARLLEKKYEPGQGALFNLKKRLPAGAGLGGGSSDCAGAMILLNKLWKLNLTISQLQELGSHLGADVPFFIGSSTAFGTGTGVELTKAPSPKPFHVFIATPNTEVPTAHAYQLLKSQKTNPIHTVKDYLQNHGSTNYFKKLTNDFEEKILEEYPKIKTLMSEIVKFSPITALLSGSGSSIFALFEDPKAAQKCSETVRNLTRFQAITKFQ